MPQVFVSIGSNINREQNIRSAIKSLKGFYPQLLISSVYESEAEGFTGDPFYNLVVGFEAEDIETINKTLRTLENQHGRTRSEEKFSSRTLDLDLLLFGDEIFQHLDVPRAEITRYAFVLWPLVEIAPDVIHPQYHKSIAELWNQFQKQHSTALSTIKPVTFVLEQN